MELGPNNFFFFLDQKLRFLTFALERLDTNSDVRTKPISLEEKFFILGQSCSSSVFKCSG